MQFLLPADAKRRVLLPACVGEVAFGILSTLLILTGVYYRALVFTYVFQTFLSLFHLVATLSILTLALYHSSHGRFRTCLGTLGLFILSALCRSLLSYFADFLYLGYEFSYSLSAAAINTLLYALLLEGGMLLAVWGICHFFFHSSRRPYPTEAEEDGLVSTPMARSVLTALLLYLAYSVFGYVWGIFDFGYTYFWCFTNWEIATAVLDGFILLLSYYLSLEAMTALRQHLSDTPKPAEKTKRKKDA